MASPFSTMKSATARSSLLDQSGVSYVIYDKPIEQIHEDPNNPRQNSNKGFEPEALQNLADDIQDRGIQNALVVRAHPEIKGEFMLISGHRRFRAAKLAGLTKVPVRISESKTYEEDQVAENLQRENLSPLEMAAVVKKYQDSGMSTRQIANKLHISQTKASFHCVYNKAPTVLKNLLSDDDKSIVDSVETINYLYTAYKENPERVEQEVKDARATGRKISVSDAKNFKSIVKEESEERRRGQEAQAAVDAAAGLTEESEDVEGTSNDGENGASSYTYHTESEGSSSYASADDSDEASDTTSADADSEESTEDESESENNRSVSSWSRVLPKNLCITVTVDGEEAILKPFRKVEQPGHVLVAFSNGELREVPLPIEIVRVEDSAHGDSED